MSEDVNQNTGKHETKKYNSMQYRSICEQEDYYIGITWFEIRNLV